MLGSRKAAAPRARWSRRALAAAGVAALALPGVAPAHSRSSAGPPDAVVRGQVVDVRTNVTRHGGDRESATTISRVEVERVVRGDAPRTVTVHTFGGRLSGGRRQGILGEPQLEEGQTVELALRRTGPGQYVLGGDSRVLAPDDSGAAGSCTGGTGYCLLGYRWSMDRLPVGFRINANGEDVTDEAAIIRASFADWEKATGTAMDFLDLGSTTTTGPHSCDASDGVVSVYWRPLGEDYADAHAPACWNEHNLMYDASVEINSDRQVSSVPGTGVTDLGWLARHEIGHVLGLDHVTGCQYGVMAVTDDGFRCTETRTIGSGDAAGAAHLYPFRWQPIKDRGYPGGGLVHDPDAASWGDGRIDVFAGAADGQIWHIAHVANGGWTSWDANVGAPTARRPGETREVTEITSAPTAVSRAPGLIDVFVRGPDLQMWQRSYSLHGGGWGYWTPRGGIFAGGFDAASWDANRVDVFGIAPSGVMYHKAWDGNWDAGWTSIPGGVFATNTDPGAVSWGPGRLDVFGRSPGGGLYQATRTSTGAFTAWTARGASATLGGSPDAGSYQSGNIEVFALHDATGPLQQLSYLNGWVGWNARGGTFAGGPGVVSWGGSQVRLDVFGRSPGGRMHHLSYAG